jgi:hypothetical protein
MPLPQRPAVRARARKALWSVGSMADLDAELPPEGQPAMPVPSSSDHYVTVDERVSGVVGVVATTWPTADAGGLRFDGAITAAWFGEAELLATVDGFRAAAGQLRRPLRIGDTFWVRGYSESAPAEWQDVWDITRQARGMARLAVASVAVGEVDTTAYALPVDQDSLAQGESAAVGPESDRLVVRPPSGPATASPVL